MLYCSSEYAVIERTAISVAIWYTCPPLSAEVSVFLKEEGVSVHDVMGSKVEESGWDERYCLLSCLVSKWYDE